MFQDFLFLRVFLVTEKIIQHHKMELSVDHARVIFRVESFKSVDNALPRLLVRR
jgi:hypothetical protein